MPLIEQLVQLFRPADPPPDDPQAYREALVDLLVWTMFVDRHLALAEQELIDAVTEDMEWTSMTPLGEFLQESSARARAVIDGEPAAAHGYLVTIGKRLHNPKDRKRVYEVCQELVNSDGKLRQEEIQHLRAIAKTFDL